MSIHREKTIQDYEDAPSGYVTLYNYKEPLMKFSKGFGYQGVLLFEGKTDKIQCHFCGKWFHQLPRHLKYGHDMSAAEYKNEVGLIQTSALISEKVREKMMASGLNERLQNLRNQGRVKTRTLSKETREKIRQGLIRAGNTMEYKNIHGTCPEQLIDRLLTLYKQQGKTPATRTIPFYEALLKTFGTYKRACEVAGITFPDPSEHLTRSRDRRQIPLEEISNFIYDFYTKKLRLPTYTDYMALGQDRYLAALQRHNQREKIEKEVILRYGRFNSSLTGMQFSPEELLEFLRKFKTMEGRKPSYSDAKRGFIPRLSRYSYHFGSWKNALSLAFPE